MNVLDENAADDQRLWLQNKRVHVRQIGYDIGRMGMDDDEIIRLMHQLDRPTFVTHDLDFYRRRLCHESYCLVHLDVDEDLFAEYVRRILRHRELNTKAKRMGRVIQAEPTSLTLWRVHEPTKIRLEW